MRLWTDVGLWQVSQVPTKYFQRCKDDNRKHFSRFTVFLTGLCFSGFIYVLELSRGAYFSLIISALLTLLYLLFVKYFQVNLIFYVYYFFLEALTVVACEIDLPRLQT
jgi:hypothetical protein